MFFIIIMVIIAIIIMYCIAKSLNKDDYGYHYDQAPKDDFSIEIGHAPIVNTQPQKCHIASDVDKEVYDQISQFCTDNGISIAAFIRLSAKEYLSNHA